jgi:hypothetical protein
MAVVCGLVLLMIAVRKRKKEKKDQMENLDHEAI